MRRPLLPAAVLLAALTALALLGAATAVRPPGLPSEADGSEEVANRRTAHRFYAAANAAIASGDLAPLTTLVSPALLADEAPAGTEPGHLGLRRRLLALHAAAPASRLEVAALAADGDLVIARVGVAGTVPAAFLGLDLVEQPAPWGPVDVLRFAGGRVEELTGTDAGAGLLEPALATGLDLTTEALRLLRVRRVTLAPAARHAATTIDGPRILYVEAGGLTVEVAGVTSHAFSTQLPAGEHLSVPAGARYAAVNAGGTPTVLLALTVSKVGDGPPDLVEPHPDLAAARAGGTLTPPGLTEQVPAAGATTVVPATSKAFALAAGPVVLALGRATLAPGARLAWAAAAGPTLLHVEAGSAVLAPAVGIAWVRGTDGRPATLGDDPLTAGDGALVVAGNAAVVRAGADAPTTLLVVTLLPATGPGAPVPPAATAAATELATKNPSPHVGTLPECVRAC